MAATTVQIVFTILLLIFLQPPDIIVFFPQCSVRSVCIPQTQQVYFTCINEPITLSVSMPRYGAKMMIIMSFKLLCSIAPAASPPATQANPLANSPRTDTPPEIPLETTFQVQISRGGRFDNTPTSDAILSAITSKIDA